MKKELYTQCKMKKDNTWHTAWIPKKMAVKNKIIKIKQNDGRWEDGWEIVEVFGEALYDDLNIQSQEHKTHREVTDI